MNDKLIYFEELKEEEILNLLYHFWFKEKNFSLPKYSL
tara:strand:+ start:430 stop:543 length:114 start_codon:yes stop_codon:yes gene_type:complete